MSGTVQRSHGAGKQMEQAYSSCSATVRREHLSRDGAVYHGVLHI